MKIGEKISRVELLEQGWTMQTVIAKTACEIWTKDSWLGTYQQSIIWRIKTQSIYLQWDKRK